MELKTEELKTLPKEKILEVDREELHVSLVKLIAAAVDTGP